MNVNCSANSTFKGSFYNRGRKVAEYFPHDIKLAKGWDNKI
jgi:hypothetical protein